MPMSVMMSLQFSLTLHGETKVIDIVINQLLQVKVAIFVPLFSELLLRTFYAELSTKPVFDLKKTLISQPPL